MLTLIWGTLVISTWVFQMRNCIGIIYNVENGCVESLKAPGCREKNGLRDGWAMAHPAHPADTALLSWAHEGFPSPSPLREAG